MAFSVYHFFCSLLLLESFSVFYWIAFIRYFYLFSVSNALQARCIVNLIEIINKIDKYSLAYGPSAVSHRKFGECDCVSCFVCVKHWIQMRSIANVNTEHISSPYDNNNSNNNGPTTTIIIIRIWERCRERGWRAETKMFESKNENGENQKVKRHSYELMLSLWNSWDSVIPLSHSKLYTILFIPVYGSIHIRPLPTVYILILASAARYFLYTTTN